MGNVSQEAILFNDTIFNNIALAARPTPPRSAWRRPPAWTNAHDFIMDTPGLRHRDRRPRLPSFGEASASASAFPRHPQGPAILIPDEATSALDTEKRASRAGRLWRNSCGDAPP